jgi:hypothetical protein
MQREGPPLESLLRRLAETPEDFLAEPRIEENGRVEVVAVAADLLRMLGVAPTPAALDPLEPGHPRADRNRLMIVLVMSWLLADEWFQRAGLQAAAVLGLLHDDATELAEVVAAKKLVTDLDRREELARVVLARLGCRPAGETVAQAQDRLTTMSSLERARVMSVSQAAARRAREIREALIRKAAEESADKYTRE